MLCPNHAGWLGANWNFTQPKITARNGPTHNYWRALMSTNPTTKIQTGWCVREAEPHLDQESLLKKWRYGHNKINIAA